MDWDQEQKMIEIAIARFPSTFGLRGHPGRLFRIERGACFVSNEVVQLYVYVLDGGAWIAFAKCDTRELRGALVRLDENPRVALRLIEKPREGSAA